jgi:hypothetical protein
MKRSASRDANATSLAGGHHLHTDAGGLSLPCLHPGHPLPQDRRVVDGLPHEDGASGRRLGDGAVEAQTIRGTRASFRSRRPVHGDLVRQAPRRGRHRSFDGKDRDRPGQRHGRELHRHPEDGARASTAFPRSRGSEERHLRVSGSVHQQAFSGNPAGVLVLEKPRQERWMQAVAAELSLSETCFLHPLPQKR